MHCPRPSHTASAGATCATKASTRVVFPMPASPVMNTSWRVPWRACFHRRCNCASSASRATMRTGGKARACDPWGCTSGGGWNGDTVAGAVGAPWQYTAAFAPSLLALGGSGPYRFSTRLHSPPSQARRPQRVPLWSLPALHASPSRPARRRVWEAAVPTGHPATGRSSQDPGRTVQNTTAAWVTCVLSPELTTF